MQTRSCHGAAVVGVATATLVRVSVDEEQDRQLVVLLLLLLFSWLLLVDEYLLLLLLNRTVLLQSVNVSWRNNVVKF